MNKLTITPFGGKDDYVYVPKEREGVVYRDCAVNTIRNLVDKRILSEIELQIMKYLMEYKYLNYNSIMFLMNANDVAAYVKKDNYEDNMSKLREYGIVGLFKNENNNQGVYALSEGAEIYCSLLKGEKRRRTGNSLPDSLDGYKINHMVSINRMFMNLNSDEKFDVKKYSINNNDYYRFFVVNNNMGNKLNFATTSVRKGDNYLVILSGCAAVAMNVFSGRQFCVVFLCEDKKHMLEVADVVSKNPICSLNNIYFITDNDVNMKALENLYTCEYVNGNIVARSVVIRD